MPYGDINIGQHWLRLWLVAPSHYLNQCWCRTNGVLWYSTEFNFAASAQNINPRNGLDNYTFKITATSLRVNVNYHQISVIMKITDVSFLSPCCGHEVNTALSCSKWSCFKFYHIEAETKWPPISRQQFQGHSLEWKYIYFDWNFTEVCSQGSNQQYSSIDHDNGLALSRRQAIIWTDDV